MKYKIILGSRITRDTRRKTFFRWFFYCILLLFFYVIMCCGAFETWQPIFIIPLATAVSMMEREMSSAVFACISGLLIDVSRGNLFGVSALWLMPLCLFISLLVMNLIQSNVINHFLITASSSVIMCFVDYYFSYYMWDTVGKEIMFRKFIFPSYIATIVVTPLVFLIIRKISVKFSPTENKGIRDIEATDENPEKERI